MGARGGPDSHTSQRGAIRTWRTWQSGEGATLYRPRFVGSAFVGEQDLGYVERAGDRWNWHTQVIPGPLGAFEKGRCPTESEARREVETRWAEWEAE